jgi:hypothetical protein
VGQWQLGRVTAQTVFELRVLQEVGNRAHNDYVGYTPYASHNKSREVMPFLHLQLERRQHDVDLLQGQWDQIEFRYEATNSDLGIARFFLALTSPHWL